MNSVLHTQRNLLFPHPVYDRRLSVAIIFQLAPHKTYLLGELAPDGFCWFSPYQAHFSSITVLLVQAKGKHPKCESSPCTRVALPALQSAYISNNSKS